MTETEKTERRNRWAGWVIIALALVFVGQGLYAQWREQARNQCFTQWNRDAAVVMTEQKAQTDQFRRSMYDLLTARAKHQNDPTAAANAYRAFLKSYEEAERSSRRHPVPSIDC